MSKTKEPEITADDLLEATEGNDLDTEPVDALPEADPGPHKGEMFAPITIEDTVTLGEHKLVPERLVGRQALVLAVDQKELVPLKDRDKQVITVRTRDEVNATLVIPLAAVSAVHRGGHLGVRG